VKHLEKTNCVKNRYKLLPCTNPPPPKKNLKQARVNIPLLPALKVNIIIVHPRGVVFPRVLSRGKTTSQG
jgi:hypothetical protein